MIAPLPDLDTLTLAHLQALPVPEFLTRIETATLTTLEILWAVAGYDAPDKRNPFHKHKGRQPVVKPKKKWYFPQEIQEALQLRLFPKIYGSPPRPEQSLAVAHAARVSVLARRRGDGSDTDCAECRANPLLGEDLWNEGDADTASLDEHVVRPVTRGRNGAAVAGALGVPQDDEAWSVAKALAEFRAKRDARE